MHVASKRPGYARRVEEVHTHDASKRYARRVEKTCNASKHMQRVKCTTHQRDTRLVKLGRRRDEFERCRIAKLRRTRKVTTWRST